MANTPATPQPPVDGNQNRGPALIAIFTTECLIALAVVLMRLYARISIKSLGVDDWIMFLTMVCSSGIFLPSLLCCSPVDDEGGVAAFRCCLWADDSPGHNRRCQASLLPHARTDKYCDQIQLDNPAVRHRMCWGWQDFYSLPYP